MQMIDERLLNKKVIVTGGSRGIGAGIVKRLVNEGAEIIIADIEEKQAKKLIEDFNTKKINFVAISFNCALYCSSKLDFKDQIFAEIKSIRMEK